MIFELCAIASGEIIYALLCRWPHRLLMSVLTIAVEMTRKDATKPRWSRHIIVPPFSQRDHVHGSTPIL